MSEFDLLKQVQTWQCNSGVELWECNNSSYCTTSGRYNPYLPLLTQQHAMYHTITSHTDVYGTTSTAVQHSNYCFWNWLLQFQVTVGWMFFWVVQWLFCCSLIVSIRCSRWAV